MWKIKKYVNLKVLVMLIIKVHMLLYILSQKNSQCREHFGETKIYLIGGQKKIAAYIR